MSLNPPVNSHDHVQGKQDAAIELVEYGDYECPYCGEAYYSIKKVQKKLGNKLKFVFRNFPLYNIHENALHAAVASEVAAGSGKFWEMHDILFENQENLEDKFLITYAQKIGLDPDKFKSDFPDPKYSEKIDADLESGLRSGVDATPSFYINGKKYDGDYSEESLIQYLESI